MKHPEERGMIVNRDTKQKYEITFHVKCYKETTIEAINAHEAYNKAREWFHDTVGYKDANLENVGVCDVEIDVSSDKGLVIGKYEK